MTLIKEYVEFHVFCTTWTISPGLDLMKGNRAGTEILHSDRISKAQTTVRRLLTKLA